MVKGTVRKRGRMVRIEIAMSACVAWRLGAERCLIGGQCCRKTKQSGAGKYTPIILRRKIWETTALNIMYAAPPRSQN